MNPPRLAGRAMQALRQLSQTSAGVAVVRAALGKDLRLDALFRAPAAARGPLEYTMRPVAGAPPRAWHDAGLAYEGARAHRTTGRALTAAFREKKTTPSEVFEALLARVGSGAFGAAVHSPYIALDRERGRAMAAASTERYAKGAPLGPLDGVPVPLKDEHHMAGMVTAGGTKYRATVEREDAWLVRELARAGAVLYGKTHSTEWGMSPLGFQSHYRVPRNVYASDRAPGGSSTGSAVAAALGLCTVASGSDGGGSIRTPSTFNGVYGIKPTFVRIGRTGGIFTSSMAATGPIGQSVGDLVDFLEGSAAVPDPSDPLAHFAPAECVGEAAVRGWRGALGRGVKGCVIGLPRWYWERAPKALAEPCLAALGALEHEGAVLRDVHLEHVEHALPAGALTIGTECMAETADDYAAMPDAFGDDLRVNLHVLASMSAREVLFAARTRTALRHSTAAALAGVSVLALPSTYATAPRFELSEDRTAISDMASMLAVLDPVFLANLTGLPAGSAPVGMVDGLPCGLQIVGDAWDEASVLAVLAAVERTGAGDLAAPPGYYSLRG